MQILVDGAGSYPAAVIGLNRLGAGVDCSRLSEVVDRSPAEVVATLLDEEVYLRIAPRNASEIVWGSVSLPRKRFHSSARRLSASCSLSPFRGERWSR